MARSFAPETEWKELIRLHPALPVHFHRLEFGTKAILQSRIGVLSHPPLDLCCRSAIQSWSSGTPYALSPKHGGLGLLRAWSQRFSGLVQISSSDRLRISGFDPLVFSDSATLCTPTGTASHDRHRPCAVEEIFSFETSAVAVNHLHQSIADHQYYFYSMAIINASILTASIFY